MSLGSNKELAENKLILLYLIDKVNIPISNLQITKTVLENKFMNYFLLQQYLNELSETGLLSCDQPNDKCLYMIAPNGKQTLSYFENLIPAGIKKRIDETASFIRRRIKNETSVSADFVAQNENEFIVSCKVCEDNFTLIELRMTVGTKNDARSICDNWKENPQVIYSEIIESLTKKRE